MSLEMLWAQIAPMIPHVDHFAARPINNSESVLRYQYCSNAKMTKRKRKYIANL